MVEIACSASDRAPASRAAARRDRVIDAARRLFACTGFHNTGIAQIARQSGVLVGQIYRDFASKEDIVIAIVERDMKDFLYDDALRAALEDNDRVALRAWIVRLVGCRDVAPDIRMVAEIVAEASRSPRVAAIVRRIRSGFRTDLLAVLERLAPAPACAREREALAEMILTLSAGIFQRRLTEGNALTDDVVAALIQGVERRIDTLVAGT